MHCSDFFAEKVKQKHSPIVLGIDPIVSKLPVHLQDEGVAGVGTFCHALIEACASEVCGIKIQLAYFEQFGAPGIALVEQIIVQARKLQLLVVMDGKRGDIASTSEAYANAYLHPESPLAGDALTVNPWLGADSLQPFVDVATTHNRMLFVLAHTSNPDAAMFQKTARNTLIELINNWNAHAIGNKSKNGCGRVGAVIGATNNSAAFVDWTTRLHASWLLTPGLGTQQGDVGMLAEQRKNNVHLLIPISRAIMYAGTGRDFALAAAAAAAGYRAQLV